MDGGARPAARAACGSRPSRAGGRGDRRLDLVELLGRRRLVDEHARGAGEDADPGQTIAPATISAAIESKAGSPVTSTSDEADEDADRGQRVGAQVGGVALERGRVVLAGAAVEEGRDDEVGDDREADHRDADAERLDLAPSTRRRVASKMMIAAPTRISIPSIAAARFSTFSWP